ncbi:hypothetical protein [Curtobacterium sp. MCPF17_052]|uniref:hypothetical protein n=1 Tax=Curtobacterium sp. MCPF17_052 TaxID=2175655 RepID=UPI0024DFBD9E|nr:hypothetical protein [Curtobacterium sp. MCPF17_052]WIB12330.1 hypothetical protein DEJ36_16735 [Curtobacterium sp. MCPF17_052]
MVPRAPVSVVVLPALVVASAPVESTPDENSAHTPIARTSVTIEDWTVARVRRRRDVMFGGAPGGARGDPTILPEAADTLGRTRRSPRRQEP